MKIRLLKFNNVKSTNDIAIKLIKSNKFCPTIISSRKQFKGRGTMGKNWVSINGNLFFSIFFQINAKKINFKQFAILNALILKKIVSKFITKKIQIKWPNDLIYQRKKFCGILQEVIHLNKKDFLIIGVGLNTNVNPKNKSFLSTSLKDISQKKIDNEKVLKSIKESYEILLKKIKQLSFLELKKYIIDLK